MNQKKKGDEQFVDWSRRGVFRYYLLLVPVMLCMTVSAIAFGSLSPIPAMCVTGLALVMLVIFVLQMAKQFNLLLNPVETSTTPAIEELLPHAQYALGADGELIELTEDDTPHLN